MRTRMVMTVWIAGLLATPVVAQPVAVPPVCEGPVADKPEQPLWKPTDLHPLPRNHVFQVPPTSPGAYSLSDALHGVERKTPPKYPYGGNALVQAPLSEYDFSYLDDPNLPDIERDYLDCLKRIHLGDDWTFSTSGQLRTRYVNQSNAFLSGFNNDFELWRARVGGDVRYKDVARFYIEFLYADATWAEIPPGLRDVDRGDFLNLWVELKVCEIGDKPAYLRVGRQELLLGSQRLLSPSEFGNVRQSFQGVRGFRVGNEWDFDAFWAQPVLPFPNRLDSVDNNVNFAGAWLTHRPKPGTTRDYYYLFLDNANHITLRGLELSPYNVHTLGYRAAGNEGSLLYDTELNLQLGRRGNENTVAGAATAGVGWNCKDMPMNPTFWLYYDYASGDQSPNSGTYNTFNPLFPFGHQYFGWIDLVGRQNIHDVSAHMFLYPMNWITIWMQYHHFELASAKDALYGITPNAVERINMQGKAGHHVGDELDFICNFHLDNHNDFQLGYCHLFAGRYIKDTAANAAQARNPSLFYMMYTYRW